eukprot:GEMP01019092.1.p1 GENE.GEMP01019092.1~~GEMP01019092.1.p1  ORF type:complete len:723 (+),score=156.64 GEMP01019092.1:51-2219(+)
MTHSPLPVFRCPFRSRVRWNEFWTPNCICRCANLRHIKISKHVRVQLPVPLAILKLILIMVVLIGYFCWYCIYYDKTYLKTAPILGEGRLQLQHPVEHCNPLDTSCKSNFAPMATLPYCVEHGNATAGEIAASTNVSKFAKWEWTSELEERLEERRNATHFVPFARQKNCRFMDEFDIETYNAGSVQSEFIVPTHVTKFYQKTLPCPDITKPCNEKYEFTKSSENKYTADIESATLLIDHSFLCAELGMENDAWSLVGMFRACKECPLWAIPVEGHSRKTWFTHWGHDRDLLDTIYQEWGATEADDTGFKAIPYGDYISIEELLKLSQTNLDVPREVNEEGALSRREIGCVIIIEVSYYNYRTNSIPNRLPPVYIYDIYEMPVEKFKATEMLWKNQYGNDDHRVVVEVHGIHVVLRLTGVVGRFSFTQTLLMIIEVGVLVGLIGWFTQCLVLNFYGGTLGDAFEDALCEEIREEVVTQYDARLSIGTMDNSLCNNLTRCAVSIGACLGISGARKTLVHVPSVGDAASIHDEKLIVLAPKRLWTPRKSRMSLYMKDPRIRGVREKFMGPYQKLRGQNYPRICGNAQYGFWDNLRGVCSTKRRLRYSDDTSEWLCVLEKKAPPGALVPLVREETFGVLDLGLTMRQEWRGHPQEASISENPAYFETFGCCFVPTNESDDEDEDDADMSVDSRASVTCSPASGGYERLAHLYPLLQGVPSDYDTP